MHMQNVKQGANKWRESSELLSVKAEEKSLWSDANTCTFLPGKHVGFEQNTCLVFVKEELKRWAN